ncbi:MAG: S9 family peptidase [Flavobacteriales bacterium]|nr:S9 family peptidase [Bacteroidales bacterium AH-315-I05]PCJ83614.1 MAG: S9 family peptidase [Flavobacteriales bacterium]
MKQLSFILLVAVIIACNEAPKIITIEYPETRKDDVVDEYFGLQVSDPYRWLEDDNSEETGQWVDAQNAVTFAYLKNIPQREKIKQRLTEVWNYPKYSAPFHEADYYFFYKNNGIQNQSVLYIQEELDGEPKVLIDPNKFSEDGTVALSGLSISKDAKYAGYMVSSAGSDWKEGFVLNIETGEKLPDHIKWVKFSGMSWYKDGFFYGKFDEPKEGEEFSQQNENQKLFYHRLGTLQDEDELIYKDEVHPKRSFSAQVTDDERFMLMYAVESTSGNGLSFRSLEKSGDFIPIITDFENDYSVIDNKGDKLLVLTNDGAPKYRVILIDTKNPSRENWQELIPEKEDVLQGVTLCNGKLVVQYLKDVSTRLYVYSLDGEMEKEIELPGLGIAGGFSAKKDDSIAFYSFVNYTTPATIFKYNEVSNTSEIYRKPEIDFEPNDYVTEQVFYKSKDGTEIPMFITHKKGIEKNGQNPTFLYGYGGFNISITPRFSIGNSAFLENGGIYAVANLRGGGEYGEDWHWDGTKLKKQNVFDDFIAAAEYLIAEGYTSKEKLAVHGRSNGGLLIGTVMTQRPDLFQVALPGVGVLDMLRYHKFTIGHYWATDYGTSEESKEMFNYLYNYSPVHNAKPAAYPATMVTTADHDDRVVPAHSFKFAAALQASHQGENPVLIRIDKKAGHGSGKPVSKRIEEAADTWAFVFYHLGMEVK